MAEDSEGRTFEFDPSVEPSLFNSTELRCIDIKLPKEKAVGVAVRRSSRQNSQIAARSRDVEAGTQTTKHTLPTDCEGVILDSLW
jgi:hypothetical protein